LELPRRNDDWRQVLRHVHRFGLIDLVNLEFDVFGSSSPMTTERCCKWSARIRSPETVRGSEAPFEDAFRIVSRHPCARISWGGGLQPLRDVCETKIVAVDKYPSA
jgi:hypothetical protein